MNLQRGLTYVSSFVTTNVYNVIVIGTHTILIYTDNKIMPQMFLRLEVQIK